MTESRSWTFDYAGFLDEGGTEAPHVWVELRGPAGRGDYPCLFDSGSSFSAFPLAVADDLGVSRAHLESTTVRTANGRCDVLHLTAPDQVFVRLDEVTDIQIAPYFFPPEVIEGEHFESDTLVLGRDFFLPFSVTFIQARELVILAELESREQ